MHYLEKRAKIIQSIRMFFYGEGFIETDTPSFVLSPGMEPHIRPIQVQHDSKKVFLPTSPEFAMKKILAQGHVSKIFQICKAYRLEPLSSTHNPEFSILEWYRTQSDYQEIMQDVEALFCYISEQVYGSLVFETKAYGKQNLSRPWLKLSIEDCFEKFLGKKLTALLETRVLAEFCVEKGFASKNVLLPEPLNQVGAWDDLFFLAMMNGIEPALQALGRPVIVFDYPESQAALSNIYTDSNGNRWGKRFEVYAGGLELGNAFDELSNSETQRARFEKDMRIREQIYGASFPANPMDEEFLEVLDKLPPSGGIAMGVDRMVMYFSGASEIEQVLWGKSWW